MVAGKPATNTLLLTNQQTGTVPPGGSVDVSFSFHATTVGRWTHDLAVRNLGNKHDQASGDLCVYCGPGALCISVLSAMHGYIDAFQSRSSCEAAWLLGASLHA